MPWRGSPQGTCSVLSMQWMGGWVWWGAPRGCGEHPGHVGEHPGDGAEHPGGVGEHLVGGERRGQAFPRQEAGFCGILCWLYFKEASALCAPTGPQRGPGHPV